MYNTTKKQLPKVVACMLALMMVLSIAPVELYTTALGAAIDKYYINVVDGENKPVADSTEITLTNKNDAAKTKTCTSINGTAVFEDFVEENEVYTVSVRAVIGYADVNAYDISVKSGDTATTVQLTALEKVTLSGVVTDENKKPYENAGVELSGYITGSTTTDADGRYSFEVFKGKDYKLTATANEKEYDVAEADVSAITGNTECNLSFKKNAAKPAIDIEFGKNGTVTEGMTENGEKEITAKANTGWYVSSFVVNGVEQIEDNQREDNFVYTITDKSVDYKITVSFAKKVYTVKLVVGENGTAKIIHGNNEYEQSVSVTYGDSISVQITPKEKSEIDNIIVKMGGENHAYNVDKEDDDNRNYTIRVKEITGDTNISVSFVTIDDTKTGTDISYSEGANKTEINKVTYVRKDTVVTIKPKDDSYKRVRVSYTKDGKIQKALGKNVTITMDKDTVITAVSASTHILIGGWDSWKTETIKCDESGPTISEVTNSEIWCKGETTYSFTVTDAESGGVDNVRYADNDGMNNATIITPTNSEYSFSVEKEDKKDFNGKYYIEATDRNGNITKKEVYVMIDNKAPDGISFSFSPVNDSSSDVIRYLSFGIFCKEKVKVTVKAQDSGSGVGTFTLSYKGMDNEDKKITTNDVETKKDEPGYFGTFVIPGELKEGGVYFDSEISVKAEDKVGNTHEETPATFSDGARNHIMIETIKPEISGITEHGKEDKIENGKIYNQDIELCFSAKDSDSGLLSVRMAINGNLVFEGKPECKDADGNAQPVTDAKEYDFKTKDVSPNEDGEYNIEIVAIDNARNESETAKLTIAKDQTSPVIQSFAFSSEEKDIALEDVASQEAYGYYFKKDANVTITAADIKNDYEAAAGVGSITVVLRDKDGKYYTVNDKKDIVAIENVSEAVQHDSEENDSFTFTIKAAFKGQIFAFATDKVGNNPLNSPFKDTPRNVVNGEDDPLKGFQYPNGSILETADEHLNEKDHIVFAKENTEFRTAAGGELYSKDVPVEITVTDTYSGIGKIEWSVESEFDSKKNQKGTVTVLNDKNGKGENTVGDTGWTQEKTENNLVYVMKKTVTVSNNSNDIVMKVKMTDRAGNTSENEIRFSIDKTAPSIEVTYDNNDPDDTYTDIFNADRTATIKVTERNFNKNDIVCKITNTDGVIPTIGSWTEHKDAANPDETYHTAEIVYHADGDYTFDIAYSDLAANKAADVAQHKFTIDQTNPVVSVSYDNMSALNGNYYKADRIATITIVEHNFDASRVNVIGTASDNGAAVSFPVTSAWSDNGNTHTATIHYSADAKYRFDIEFNDKAGNSIADYTPEEFYVDKTAPKLEIGGVADKSANNDVVAPTITFTDTNFNANAVKFVLMGVRNGEVVYSSSSEAITNGQRVTFADFERTRKVDDIYVLTATTTDMAGNETTGSISFSANRFGSVYELATIGSLIGKYLQSEEDIVFTETNVDSLKKGETKIKLTKNGTPKDLVEGTDYTITVTGGNGQWSQYKYTINKTLFADDGRYSISVYSVDAAGNINENIDETKEAEISFGIDKTSPVIVPVDFESGVQYPVEVKKASVEVKDNLVLEGVKIYLNGTEVKYENEGETYTFDIPEKNEKQNVKIVAVDAAGNEHTLSVENFLVSTNLFVRWFNNTPLFIGSIVGVILLCAVIIFLVIYKRRKSGRK